MLGENLAGLGQPFRGLKLTFGVNIAGEKSSTIVFPLPMDLASSLGVGKKKE